MSFGPSSFEDLAKRNEEYLPRHRPMYHYRPENFQTTERLLIVSCMDQRVVPEEFCGLVSGEIPVVRCSGGRVKFAINDIAVLNGLIGLTEIVVIHHQDCGLVHKSADYLRAKVEARSKEAAAKIDFENFDIIDKDFRRSLQEDLDWLRANPLISKDTKLTGAYYDIDNGKLEKILTR